MKLTSKLKLKLYFEPKSVPASHVFVETFHRWIQSSALDELMIDVADYDHVHGGPSTYFCGHSSDYIIDRGEGRVGLVYVRKRVANDAAEVRLRDGLERIAHVAKLLESHVPGLRVAESELRIVLLDRLNAPNTESTFRDAEAEVKSVLGERWGGMSVTYDSAADPREPLALRVKGTGDASWAMFAPAAG